MLVVSCENGRISLKGLKILIRNINLDHRSLIILINKVPTYYDHAKREELLNSVRDRVQKYYRDFGGQHIDADVVPCLLLADMDEDCSLQHASAQRIQRDLFDAILTRTPNEFHSIESPQEKSAPELL